MLDVFCVCAPVYYADVNTSLNRASGSFFSPSHPFSAAPLNPVFQRTAYLTQNEWKKNSVEVLAHLVPGVVQKRLFGYDEDHKKDRNPCWTAEQLLKRAASRRAPIIHVYVLSTTTHQRLQNVEFLFQKLPARIWKVQRSDFVSSDSSLLQGTYESMGLDRLAATRAAAEHYGTPTLVIDGGTALTYTALDRQGAFMGGGILAGVNMRLKALRELTGQLPYVSPKELMEAVERRLAPKKPLPPLKQFATESTSEHIMAGVLYELTDTLVGIIQQWKADAAAQLEEPGDQAASDSDVEPPLLTQAHSPQDNGKRKSRMTLKRNEELVVAIAGGDAPLLNHLLAPNHSGIIEPVRGAEVLNTVHVAKEMNVRCTIRRDANVCVSSNLTHI